MSAVIVTSVKKGLLRWLEDISTQMERFGEDVNLDTLNDPDEWRVFTDEWKQLRSQINDVRRALGEPVWD